MGKQSDTKIASLSKEELINGALWRCMTRLAKLLEKKEEENKSNYIISNYTFIQISEKTKRLQFYKYICTKSELNKANRICLSKA